MIYATQANRLGRNTTDDVERDSIHPTGFSGELRQINEIL